MTLRLLGDKISEDTMKFSASAFAPILLLKSALDEMNEFVPRGFSWLVPGKIAALAFPDEPSDFEYLINHGIRHLISLTQEMKPQVENFPQLTWADFGIQDYGTFSLEQIHNIIQICEHATTHNQAVAVHCRAGKGRTGTILACYLIRFHNFLPNEAIQRVRSLRPGSIETSSQEETVFIYYKFLCKKLQSKNC